LPASFSALRPASLPAPSRMRAGRPPSHDAYSNNIMLSLPRPSEPVSKVTNGKHKDKEDTTDQDTSEDTTDSSPRPTSDSDTDSEGEYRPWFFSHLNLIILSLEKTTEKSTAITADMVSLDPYQSTSCPTSDPAKFSPWHHISQSRRSNVSNNKQQLRRRPVALYNPRTRPLLR
jgi:hypothetical protein